MLLRYPEMRLAPRLGYDFGRASRPPQHSISRAEFPADMLHLQQLRLPRLVCGQSGQIKSLAEPDLLPLDWLRGIGKAKEGVDVTTTTKVTI